MLSGHDSEADRTRESRAATNTPFYWSVGSGQTERNKRRHLADYILRFGHANLNTSKIHYFGTYEDFG